jgi:hypothetical protein
MNGLSSTFSIFPNPSTGQFSIRLPENSNLSFSITIEDISGMKIYSTMVQANGNVIPVKVNGLLSRGIYVVKLQGNGLIRMGKLVIK